MIPTAAKAFPERRAVICFPHRKENSDSTALLDELWLDHIISFRCGDFCGPPCRSRGLRHTRESRPWQGVCCLDGIALLVPFSASPGFGSGGSLVQEASGFMFQSGGVLITRLLGKHCLMQWTEQRKRRLSSPAQPGCARWCNRLMGSLHNRVRRAVYFTQRFPK